MLTRDFEKEIEEIGSLKSFLVRELEIGLPWVSFGFILALRMCGVLSGWVAAGAFIVSLLVAALVTAIVAW